MAWVEEYLVRRKLGQKGIDGLGAREVEAFLILEHELAERTANAGAGRQERLRTKEEKWLVRSQQTISDAPSIKRRAARRTSGRLTRAF